MSPPANLTTLIVLAGFGIAAGITVLYNYLTNPESQEEPNAYRQDQRSCHRRRSPSPPLRRQSSPARPSLRAISLPSAIPAAVPATSTSGRRNGVRRKPEDISNCQLCKGVMRNLTIKLDCMHIFHDECYTIWRHGMVMCNPHAQLCPIC